MIKYPLQGINDLFDPLKSVGIFSKIDLRLGYHQLRIRDVDVAKSTFRSRYGHYEFLLMSIGLINATTAFIDLINMVFHKYNDEFVIVFVDDILIYFDNEELNKKYLRMAVDGLRENPLYAKLS